MLRNDRRKTCTHAFLPATLLVPAALAVAILSFSSEHAEAGDRGTPWPRHVIDDSSRGADGVRLCDVNGDSLPDVTTGWEQGGISRVYLHPGYADVKTRWPAVTVGHAPNVEDAVFADLDADGRIDVVSSCEGGTQTIFVHWAPKGGATEYLDPTAWQTEPIPASVGRTRWMFAAPLEVDGQNGVDLLAASKDPDAQIGWFQSPKDARRLEDWQWHPIGPAGWIMSLKPVDMDGDGDLDVLTTDRKGEMRGCRWLENPGQEKADDGEWENHYIGAQDHEAMFMTMGDLDADGREDVILATKDNGLIWLRRRSGDNGWESSAIEMPGNVGTGKGVGVGDINLDGKRDLVFSCENAKGDSSGVIWLSYKDSPAEEVWTDHEISGPDGIKFDRLELIDLDNDGDLDVLTCEERHPAPEGRQGLGVFWYENPSISR